MTLVFAKSINNSVGSVRNPNLIISMTFQNYYISTEFVSIFHLIIQFVCYHVLFVPRVLIYNAILECQDTLFYHFQHQVLVPLSFYRRIHDLETLLFGVLVILLLVI